MANRLDLDEQEQLDRLKHFWNQYGNLITWTLILALGGYAAFNGWNLWQRDRAVKAAALYDELELAARAGDADKAVRAFSDLKDRYPSTTYAVQAGLLAAKVQADKGQADAARASLEWVVAQAGEKEYQALARLRLAGLLLDAKQYDAALQQLPADAPPAFAGLVADRRGDVLMAQGKPQEAKAAYRAAWDALDATLDYRRLVEAKLGALGAAPEAAAAPATGASK